MAFNGTELDSIELPDGLEVIERAAFRQQLYVYTIPDSVESIGEYAFGGNALEGIVFAGTAPNDPDKLYGAFKRNKLSSFGAFSLDEYHLASLKKMNSLSSSFPSISRKLE